MPNFEMQKNKTSSFRSGSSTQYFLAISEVKEDVIVMKDGSLRAVIAVSSTNFILKSPEEQEAILSRYQAFLNTLDFPIQILVQSRKLDIHGYLEKIKEKQMQQTNELLRVQTEEYIEYISKLLELGNIMNKTFYAVVPFYSGDPVKAGFSQRFKNLINPAQEIAASQRKMTEELGVLADRVARVANGLSSLGLRVMRLNTQDLVELLYNSYNVGSAAGGTVDMAEFKLN